MTFVDAINEKSARSTVSLTAGRGRVNNQKIQLFGLVNQDG